MISIPYNFVPPLRASYVLGSGRFYTLERIAETVVYVGEQGEDAWILSQDAYSGVSRELVTTAWNHRVLVRNYHAISWGIRTYNALRDAGELEQAKQRGWITR